MIEAAEEDVEEEEDDGGWRVWRGVWAVGGEEDEGEVREASQILMVRSKEPEATQRWSRLREYQHPTIGFLG